MLRVPQEALPGIPLAGSGSSILDKLFSVASLQAFAVASATAPRTRHGTVPGRSKASHRPSRADVPWKWPVLPLVLLHPGISNRMAILELPQRLDLQNGSETAAAAALIWRPADRSWNHCSGCERREEREELAN